MSMSCFRDDPHSFVRFCKMNRLQFLLGIILLPLGSGSVFKGTPFSGDIWPKLLSEIPEIPVDSKILCGSICQQNGTALK